MHRSHRDIGEGHAGKERAQQHVLAHQRVGAMAYGRGQVGIEQLQRLECQRIRKRILLQSGREGLNRVHHGIDTGHGRHRRRHARRQLRPAR